MRDLARFQVGRIRRGGSDAVSGEGLILPLGHLRMVVIFPHGAFEKRFFFFFWGGGIIFFSIQANTYVRNQ